MFDDVHDLLADPGVYVRDGRRHPDVIALQALDGAANFLVRFVVVGVLRAVVVHQPVALGRVRGQAMLEEHMPGGGYRRVVAA